MTSSCLYSSSQAILKLSQSTTGHFVTLTESGMHLISCNPGVRFSKDLKTLRARKAIRKTPTRLFYKAGLFISR